MLGLAIALVIVATDPDVNVGVLRQIHADSAATHDVGGTYVAGWTSPQWNPFVDGRFRILTLLASIVYLTSVTAIGATIIGAIRGVDRWPLSVRLLSGFLPGYLIVLAPLQLLFAGVPYLTASWISLVAVPVIAVLLHRQSLAAAATGLRSDPDYRRRWLGAAAMIGGVLLLCGVHRLQAGRNFGGARLAFCVPRHGPAATGGASGSHLAQWDQQSDEWCSTRRCAFTSAHGQDFLFSFWAEVRCVRLVRSADLRHRPQRRRASPTSGRRARDRRRAGRLAVDLPLGPDHARRWPEPDDVAWSARPVRRDRRQPWVALLLIKAICRRARWSGDPARDRGPWLRNDQRDSLRRGGTRLCRRVAWRARTWAGAPEHRGAPLADPALALLAWAAPLWCIGTSIT